MPEELTDDQLAVIRQRLTDYERLDGEDAWALVDEVERLRAEKERLTKRLECPACGGTGLVWTHNPKLGSGHEARRVCHACQPDD